MQSAVGNYIKGSLIYTNLKESQDKNQVAGGIFTSDFTHGIEVFYAMIIKEDDTEKLILRKITGDPNVPAGKVSIKCSCVPEIGKQDLIDSKI